MIKLQSRFNRLLAAAALTALFAMPTPEVIAEEAVLTVTPVNKEGVQAPAINFTLDEIKALPGTEFVTNTIWTKGQRLFRGVSLHSFLDHVGSTGTKLKATAANDYSVEIPVSDAVENGPIIAYEMDEKALTIRDKGPLWIVYPYDHDPKYQTEAVYSRSIWQLVAIEVIE